MLRDSSMWVCVLLASSLAGMGCASDDGMNMPRPGVFNPTAGVAGNTGGIAGAGTGTAGTGTSGGTAGMFGNPIGPMQPIGPTDGTTGRPGSMCLEATVAFVIDGSGSMCEVFGGSTRWRELRTALVDPMNGLIYRLQHAAKFGVAIYDGSVNLGLATMATGGSPTPMCAGAATFGRTMDAQCMQVREVAPAKGNADAIAAMFPMRELGGSTPTDRVMNQVVDQLIAAQAGLDLSKFPHFIILATDGQPNDICAGGAGGDGVAQQQAVIAAVDRAAAAQIKTYVISLAGGDAALQAHLDEVARHGNPGDPTARTFSPANTQELVDALVLVLGNALNCAVD
jgi:hypothetical protein